MECGCGKPVGSEREELGLKVCIDCARQGCGQSRPVGRMIYSHKTAPELQIMSPEKFKETSKYCGSVSLKSEYY